MIVFKFSHTYVKKFLKFKGYQWNIQKVKLDVYGSNRDLFILDFYDNDVQSQTHRYLGALK
jgi:hypothetical protein